MEKLLLPAMLGLIAAFLTTILGFTKLINDKEGKVSEFRQEWTSSLRETLSNIVSYIENLFELIEKRHKRSIICYRLSVELSKTEPDTSIHTSTKETLNFNKNYLEKINDEVIENKKIIYKNISLALLHFKPQDDDFIHVEKKIEKILDIISELDKNNSTMDNDQLSDSILFARSESKIICQEIMQFSRLILKKEWERIKTGERNYKKTKRLFKYGFFISLIFFIIFIFFLFNHNYNFLTIEKIKNIYFSIYNNLFILQRY